jgi:hypothetical protein
VTKPFSNRELIARVAALLGRPPARPMKPALTFALWLAASSAPIVALWSAVAGAARHRARPRTSSASCARLVERRAPLLGFLALLVLHRLRGTPALARARFVAPLRCLAEQARIVAAPTSSIASPLEGGPRSPSSPRPSIGSGMRIATSTSRWKHASPSRTRAWKRSATGSPR